MNIEAKQRYDLTEFLHSRRARLRPLDVGIIPNNRRRATGLRREEVASLANISVTWYTWLEQGRDIRISAPALMRIATALRLDDGERRHLFTLANQVIPRTLQGEVLSPALQHMLDEMGNNAAYLLNRCWDVLDWSPASASFIDYDEVPPDTRNLIYDFFVEPKRKTEFVDWERHARRMLAEFRASCGRHPDDPRLAPLIERCQNASAEFREWWPQHEVQETRPGTIEICQPNGLLTFSYASFWPSDAGRFRLTLYTPADETTHRAVAIATRKLAPRIR